ncbi:MAG: MinD/ParA family protein [Syntrophomonadaceae bacterium]|jgi:flagellar biosynthesis protein FlhG
MISDQADKLRKMAQGFRKQIEAEMMGTSRKTRTIAISSGKGGVGKSTLALNLALSLCNENQRVVLMDADLGLANIDIMLGLAPEYHIQHLVQGRKSLKDIIITGPQGLKIIPGGSGITELANLSDGELKRLLLEVGKLDGDYDYMIIDTGAGISRGVMSFMLAADEVIVITTPEPTSLTDAYGCIKTMAKQGYEGEIAVVVNQVTDQNEGLLVAEKFRLVCRQFLNVNINMLGIIPTDALVGEVVRQQKALMQAYPRSNAARHIQKIARNLTNDSITAAPEESHGSGIRKFFQKITRLMRDNS